jgi:hypothetical protein
MNRAGKRAFEKATGQPAGPFKFPAADEAKIREARAKFRSLSEELGARQFLLAKLESERAVVVQQLAALEGAFMQPLRELLIAKGANPDIGQWRFDDATGEVKRVG